MHHCPDFPEIFDDLGPYVLAKVTFAYDAGGTMKAWNIAGTEAKQVRVHFIQRKCDGEAFNLHDLDGASLGVRDLTLEALQSLLATTPPIATKSEPVQSTSAAPSSPSKDVPSVPQGLLHLIRLFWLGSRVYYQYHSGAPCCSSSRIYTKTLFPDFLSDHTKTIFQVLGPLRYLYSRIFCLKNGL